MDHNNKKILVPVDFTKTGEIGLDTAVNIARQINARIDLVHIIDEPAPHGVPTDGDLQAKAHEYTEYDHFLGELLNKRKEQMEVLKDRYTDSNIEMKSFLEYGKFTEGLEKHLKKEPADLVVMGTTGETSISELFKGSHAARTIRKTGLPVLAVKEFYSLTKGDKLLILVDLRQYDKTKVQSIRNFATLFDMEVHIAHIKRNKDLIEDSINKYLEEFAKSNDFKNYSLHVIGKGHKSEKVEDFMDNWKINIVTTISEGDSGLARLFFGSDTEEFLEHVDKALLAVSE